MQKTLVIASTNLGKIREIQDLLKGLLKDWDIQSLQDYTIEAPDEPYETFMENAIHKAKYYAKKIHQPILCEDSGLSIEALNGFPGVRTKEFSKACGGMPNTFIELEKRLKDIPHKNAQFYCATVLYLPESDSLITHEAFDKGQLTFPPRGNDGFAYDPIFIPEGYDQTFAELGHVLKNKISHRAEAIKGLIAKLNTALNAS